MGRPKKNTAVEKPAAAPPTVATVEIRDAIKTMSGFNNVEELSEVIPESTATRTGEILDPVTKQKRKRRTKAEMIDGGATPLELKQDKRYMDAVNRMSAFGGAETVKTAFKTTGKALDPQETTEVDDYFYVISRKYSLDASRSGLFLSVYAVLLIIRLITTRMMGGTSANLWSHFQGMFQDRPQQESAEETPESPSA